MAWSETAGTKVVSNIYAIGKYPTHIDTLGRGGLKTVTSISERDAIPIDRLTLGTEVRVTLPDGTSTVYYLSKLPTTINSDTTTGKDCEWTEVKGGGLDEESLSSIKGQPLGLAELDADGKGPASQTRTIIFRGTYQDENTFNSLSGTPHVGVENALYIDNNNGKMYSYTNGKFIRDTIYWEEV